MSYSDESIVISVFIIIYIIILASWAFIVVCHWRIYEKAGRKGWAAVVPYYDGYTMYDIAWGEGWYFPLEMVPYANYVFMIIKLVKLAKAFGRSGGFAVGLVFLYPVFIGILAFGDNRYIGPNGIPANGYPYGTYYGYNSQRTM